jgi:hypothetical protein
VERHALRIPHSKRGIIGAVSVELSLRSNRLDAPWPYWMDLGHVGYTLVVLDAP